MKIKSGYHLGIASDRELRDAGARDRALLEGAPVPMLVVNERGQLVLLNFQAERHFGYRRDELIGKGVKQIIPEGFLERVSADGARETARSLARQVGIPIELAGLHKDGGIFPIEVMLSPLETEQGLLVTAVVRDISVRKEAEKQLARMESRYRGLLEAAPDAMVVLNQRGQIVLLNAQAEKRFGYQRHELVGQTVKKIIPQGLNEQLAVDCGTAMVDAQQLDKWTARVPSAFLRVELYGRRKDGSSFPIEIVLSRPLESSDDVLVTAAIRDISVRKAAEKQLAEAEGRYRGLLEAAPDAMVVVSQSGTIELLNAQLEHAFGYQRTELVGRKVTTIIPRGLAEQFADDLRAGKSGRAGQSGGGIELTGKRKDGSEFPIEVMLRPLESADGISVTATIRDITWRKVAEAHLLQKVAELHRSNEELEQFAYVASHDLQEPLRMVASYTQLLSRRYKGKLDADADEFIAFAVNGASRMQRLIHDLLIYSRVGTQGKELRASSCEDALDQALKNLRGAIDESRAQVTHDPLPIVLADEMQLVQLFQNLVGNAIKYQNPGIPRVHVSASKAGAKRWLFCVRDNGLGIDPQYFERIFGMFQRLHKREAFAGTGIGLAICKKIVERHGGSIAVDSQPGQGSGFSFSLAEI
jgi:PAS domain S-box-containing protein